MSHVTEEDRPEQEFTWDWHQCEVCGELATHELWWGDELMHRYCAPCMSEKASAMEQFWRDVDAAGELEESKEAPA